MGITQIRIVPIRFGDKVYGLGTIDMKSFFGVVLNNVEKLKQLNSPIVIVATGDEETTLSGASLVEKKLRELNIVPKFTILGEPTSSTICSKGKSCFEYAVEVTGKRCHSSNPSCGVNANYIVARLMLKIEELCDKYPETTLSCNVVSGGKAVNIISDKAKIKFDLRTFSRDSVTLIENELNDYILDLMKKYEGSKIELKKTLSIPPFENKNTALVDRLCEKLGKPAIVFNGGCEAGYYQAVGGDAIVYGIGDLGLAHKPNEFLEINEFEKYNDTFVDFIKFCCV